MGIIALKVDLGGLIYFKTGTSVVEKVLSPAIVLHKLVVSAVLSFS